MDHCHGYQYYCTGFCVSVGRYAMENYIWFLGNALVFFFLFEMFLACSSHVYNPSKRRLYLCLSTYCAIGCVRLYMYVSLSIQCMCVWECVCVCVFAPLLIYACICICVLNKMKDSPCLNNTRISSKAFAIGILCVMQIVKELVVYAPRAT